jgi:hypothetical protein
MKTARHDYARTTPADRRRADRIFRLLAILLVGGAAAAMIAIALAVADRLGWLDQLRAVLS